MTCSGGNREQQAGELFPAPLTLTYPFRDEINQIVHSVNKRLAVQDTKTLRAEQLVAFDHPETL